MFLQRFTSVSGCKPQASLAPGERQQGGCYYYDNITAHSLDAAARHGRTLAMMYDISGCGDDAWNRTSADWVSRHGFAAIWVAFFSRWQRYRC